MKKFIYLLVFSTVLISCSKDDDPRDDYPQNLGITFQVSSTDNSRNSLIETTILGDDIEQITSSYSDEHLPFERDYINQRVTFNTVLNLFYRDNSGGEVGVAFEPYTITMTIRVDNAIVANQEFLIESSGDIYNLGYDLD